MHIYIYNNIFYNPDLINKNNSIGLGGFYHDNDLFNDPFNDPFSNDFGVGSGSPFDDHF